MTLNADFRAIWTALRRCSPVVVNVPPGIRFMLMQRYITMSRRNGTFSLLGFGFVIFGLAWEAPLAPRLAAGALLAALIGLRYWRSQQLLSRLDPDDPKSDPVYDAMVVASAALWGTSPFLLQGHISPTSLLAVLYAVYIGVALQSITYLWALPASVVMVGAMVVPLSAFMLLQASWLFTALAAGTLVGTAAVMMRIVSGHKALVRSLAAERQNAALVQELQSYRLALEDENATLGSSLRDASNAADRDPLTGLFNRRHIVAFAQRLGEGVHRDQEDVSICMVDVDHFKHVNDRHGHPVGDVVLRAVGGLLGARLRDGDCLARIGGEEFMAVLRSCDVNRARRVAESLRHNVAASYIDTVAGEVPVTVSVGVAQWAPGEAFEAAVERADRALYAAKHSGRDRVEIDRVDAQRLAYAMTDFAPTGPLH